MNLLIYFNILLPYESYSYILIFIYNDIYIQDLYVTGKVDLSVRVDYSLVKSAVNCLFICLFSKS